MPADTANVVVIGLIIVVRVAVVQVDVPRPSGIGIVLRGRPIVVGREHSFALPFSWPIRAETRYGVCLSCPAPRTLKAVLSAIKTHAFRNFSPFPKGGLSAQVLTTYASALKVRGAGRKES